jgi:molybdate transport system substrate-binding protein
MQARMLPTALALIAFFAMAAPAGAADIRVYSGGAPALALRGMAPEFEAATGHKMQFTFALVTDIQQKLAAGEKADLILLPVPLIAATEKSLPLRTEGRAVIARVGIGVIVREGAPRPDISTPDATRKLLLDARSVALPDPIAPAGAHLERMVSQFGIANELRPKTIVKAAIHGGGELVAKGDAEVGMYLLSEVQSIKGIEVVGLLPAALQSFVVYGSAIPGYNDSPEPAAAFVKFATEPSKAVLWKAAGFELTTR